MARSESSSNHSNESPVTPVDVVNPERSRKSLSWNSHSDTQEHDEKPSSNVRSPKTARFAEATSVNSPINATDRSPFADPTAASGSGQAQQSGAAVTVSDLGFGYVADSQPERHATFPQAPQPAALTSNPPGSPLKSALKTPGTARTANPLSPTFREEQILEWHEKDTEKQNANDVKIKARVRLAKVFLRGVSFSCSLIVLALVASSFVIFNATRNLAARNNLSPWAPDTNPWPQIFVLVVACLSLLFSMGVIYGYCRGGHKRAEKVALYYTVFSVLFLVVFTIMWVVATAVLQNSKQTGNNKDFWGWACVDNQRRTLFEDTVNYSLICRMQDWSLVCCIIEVIVEIMAIAIYAVVFYRFYSKRKLKKAMDMRDKARSDLYLAHLRSQSALNSPVLARTPGFPPTQGFPRTPGSPFYPDKNIASNTIPEEGPSYSTQYATPQSASGNPATSQPFQLQPPPIRIQEATPTLTQGSFSPQTPTFEHRREHVHAAPGERTFDAVPIPAAYTSPMASPTFMPQAQSSQGVPGMALTTDEAVDAHTSSQKS